MTPHDSYEQELKSQTRIKKTTVKLFKIAHDLWYNNSIELVLFRNQILDKNVNEIIDLHHYATHFVGKKITVDDTLQIAKAIQEADLNPSRLDLGKLAYEFNLENSENATDFISNKLSIAKTTDSIIPRDTVLYGFGRIGRLLARELTNKAGKGSQLRLRAIVTRGTITPEILEKRASLLKTDSVHGYFKGTVSTDYETNALIINGSTVYLISANQPEDIDYTKYGIQDALVIDNTGAFRDYESLNRHLKAKGTSKVLLTAPGKGVPNIVYGVNHEENKPDDIDIFSAASCTTNAITPVLKVIEEEFGIIQGHLETIHAYTNDQNLVDNMHKKYRRGRAAGLNMVITETGAGQAVAKALPSLNGKLSSNAIRVPVPNGSLAILNLQIEKETTLENLNNTIKKYALEGKLVEQIKYSIENELVSSDIVGSSAPSIYDSKATIVNKGGKNIILYVWYDNEYGYSHQVIRLAKHVANVRRYTYY
ncbi:MAG: glyceraldehyde-3-phosphate dehydrogenase [Flavobacteriales bacterium]